MLFLVFYFKLKIAEISRDATPNPFLFGILNKSFYLFDQPIKLWLLVFLLRHFVVADGDFNFNL